MPATAKLMQNPRLKTIIRWLCKGSISVVVLWLCFVSAGRVLCNIAIAQIAGLTNTKIKAESVDFNLNGSVLIEKLVIRPRRVQRYDDAILKAEAVYARFYPGSMLLLRPRLKEITVNDFVFDARYDVDIGRWNVAGLKIVAPRAGAGKMPLVCLKKGLLRYSKVSKGQTELIAAVPIDVGFERAEKMPGGYSFNITTAGTAGLDKNQLTGLWQPGRITIAGGISLTDVREPRPSEGRGEFEELWSINVLAGQLSYDRNRSYRLKLKIKDLLSTHSPTLDAFGSAGPSFLEKFGPLGALRRFFNRYRPVGRVDIDLEASGSLNQPAESTLAGKLYCKDVSICDRKFPYVIEHLTGRIDFTEKNAVLNNLCGRHGGVELSLNGWSNGFGPNWRYKIRITSNNMALDDDLHNALSAKQKRLWSVFSPGGLATIDYRRSRQSQTDKKTTLTVELLDAEAVYRHFPYPLKNLTGRLLFDRESITVSDVVSQSDGCKITINGKVTQRDTGRPIYDISVKADNVPLDSTLAAALPAEQSKLAGLVDTGGSVRIEDVTGRIWSTKQSSRLHYRLSLQNRQLELNDDSLGLLPGPLEKVVSELQPTGRVNCRVDLDRTPGAESPAYKITIDCLGNSINPGAFAYPLKELTGGLTITADGIELKNITASGPPASCQRQDGGSTVKINGRITLADNAFSGGRFTLDANNICFDEQLSSALPESIAPLYRRISPAGRFDLNFEDIKITRTETNERYVDFSGTARFKACSFNTSPAITKLDAELKFSGLYKMSDGFRAGRAELIADRLRIKGKSLTAVGADINYDRRRRSWLTKNLCADSYDGRLTGRLELKAPAEAALEYLLQAGFDDIDLKQFLSDTRYERRGTRDEHGTSGKMNGSLSIVGRIGTAGGEHLRDPAKREPSRIGRCRLQITDMQVGKLSPLAKLLYVLSPTEPKDFAFERMLVDSYIRDDRLSFKKFDLSGEALAFSGSGWMDLQSQDVDLTLTARGHRLATAEPSIFGSLTEAVGQGIVRMQVSGNFHDPQVTTETLPVIKETLEILGTRPTKK